MSFPLMPIFSPSGSIPSVTFCGAATGIPTTMGNLGADHPDRYLVITRASGGTSTVSLTISINGVAQTVWYPQSDGTVASGATGFTQFVVVKVPTGTSVTVAASGTASTGGETAWYTVIGLDRAYPIDGNIKVGNPATCSVTMEQDGIVFGALWADNDNNSFTWSSPMIRTVNNTSLGNSRGASMAYRQNTTGGAYSVSASMASGTIYMGAVVLR
jgi:hypothetical protein